jgi:hypothetical protein
MYLTSQLIPPYRVPSIFMGKYHKFYRSTVKTSIHPIRLDSYPQGFDCSNPTVWSPVTTNYHTYHAKVNPSQAWYIPGMVLFSYTSSIFPSHTMCL